MSVPRLRFPGFGGEWEEKEVGKRLAKVIDYRGKAPPKSETGMPLITARNVRMGFLDFDADEYIDASLYKSWMNRGLPKPNDVLFTTEAPLGNVALYPHSGTYALGQRIITLQPKPTELDSIFLFQYLLGPIGQDAVAKRGTGSTAKGIKSKLFVKIPMAAPTLSEQKKIASFLGVVDAKIAALRARVLGLQTYKRGLMHALFSQTLRFTRPDGTPFPDWEEKPFAEIASRSRVIFDPTMTNLRPTLVELENIESMSGKIIGESDLVSQISLKTEFRAGDVLFGKLRPYLRKFARPEFDGVCSSEIWVMRGTKVSNSFLYYLVQSSRFNQLANISSGSKMPRSDWAVIAESGFEISHPDEQAKIADALSAMDAKIAAVSTQVAQMQAFKTGLLQQMFV